MVKNKRALAEGEEEGGEGGAPFFFDAGAFSTVQAWVDGADEARAAEPEEDAEEYVGRRGLGATKKKRKHGKSDASAAERGEEALKKRIMRRKREQEAEAEAEMMHGLEENEDDEEGGKIMAIGARVKTGAPAAGSPVVAGGKKKRKKAKRIGADPPGSIIQECPEVGTGSDPLQTSQDTLNNVSEDDKNLAPSASVQKMPSNEAESSTLPVVSGPPLQRKRPKMRSKQKNRRKDTRTDEQKPPHLREGYCGPIPSQYRQSPVNKKAKYKNFAIAQGV
jgi:hypothetical protein